VSAAAAHRTMMTTFANQLRLQAGTGGWELPLAAEAAETGEVGRLLEPLVRAGAARTGSPHGMAAAEEFRVVTFGGMGALLDMLGRKR
jgi:hypothetical protein